MSASAIIGRDAELAELEAALAAAAHGQGSLFLISGEPGIGKSTLVEAFAARAAAASATVVSGRAWEAGGAPAFWPWIEVLRELVGMLDAEAAAASGGRLAMLLDLVPELAERVPGLVRPAALDPAGERFRLFDAVTAALRWCARRSPLVVTLDDVHAADPATLALLQFAARKIARSGVVVIATYRDVEARLTPAVASELAAVSREGRTLALHRLDRGDVARFVAASGAEPSELADRLFELTEGNPLFLIESFRLLRGRGAGAAQIPPGVREVIAARLRTLSRPARELLEIGAIRGRTFDVAIAAELAGIATAEAVDRLGEALAIEIIDAHAAERFAFTHILLREVLYGGMTAARRSELHAAVARALIARDRGDPNEPLTEIVHHLIAAAATGCVDEVVLWSARAAERAVARLAFEEAVEILERAVTALGSAPERDRERCDLLLALADARIRSGRDVPGRASAAKAAELARRLGDGGALAKAALTYGRVIGFAVVDPVLVGLLEEALAATPEQDGERRAQLLARLASAHQPARDPFLPAEMAREAIALARQCAARPAAQLAVLASANSALGYFAPPDERRALNEEMAELAARLGDKLAGLRAYLRLVFDHLERGDPIGADVAIAAYARLAGEVGHPAYQWQVSLLGAMRALMRGRIADAEDMAAEARALTERTGASTVALPLTIHELGRLRLTATPDVIAAGAPALLSRTEQLADMWYARCCAVGMMAATRRPAAIRAAIERLGFPLTDLRGRMMVTWVGEAAAEIGDEVMARQVLPLVSAMAARNHSWGVGAMVCEGPIASTVGRLAALCGDREQAAAQFDVALARAEALDAPGLLAVTRLDAGATMVRGAGEAERETGRRLLGEAAEAAERLGLAGVAVAAREAHDAVGPAGQGAARPAVGASVPATSGLSLERDGDTWAVRGEGKTFRLKHSRGLEILAHLVDNPDREFHVTDLLAPSGERGLVEDAGELLDGEAVAQYRRRLTDLKEELDEAERWSDLGRADRLREEMEFLAGELSRAVGLGGRRKRAASTSERARVNVQRRLRHAIDKIAEHSPGLGKHLEWAVRTGHFCGYYPAGR